MKTSNPQSAIRRLCIAAAAAFSFIAAPVAHANNNADLSDLTISSGTLAPVFDSATINYSATVTPTTTSITVTPTVADPLATVTVNGNSVTSGSPSGSINLNFGTNVISTVVTAEDAVTTKTYTITVTRQGLVIHEPFAQTAGSISGKAASTTGLTGNWTLGAGTVNLVNPDTITHGALANSGGQVDIPSASTVHARVTTSSALADAGLLADGAELWFSLVFQKTSTAGSSNEWSGFAFGSNYVVGGPGAVNMNGSGNGVGFITKGAAVDVTTWTGGANTRTTSHTVTSSTPTVIVGKIKWGATAGDVETITLYKASSDLSSLGTGFSRTMTGVDQTTFKTISFTQRDSGGTHTYDEIRFGATQADVLPLDTVAPTLLSITDNMAGGPIGEDVAEVTYTLTFDEHMDLSTITSADFDNAGTATTTVGTVAQASPAVITVKLLPTTTGTVQLRIPATSVLKSLAQVNLDTTADILGSTVTINAGPTPNNGLRYWDGPTTTGITNGVSGGGNGTWSTANTNWDRGAGFEAPLAWNDGNLSDKAVFGGSAASTVTVAEDINLGGLTIANANTTTFNGAFTLNFSAGSSILHDDSTGSRAATINQGITGSPTVTVAAGEALTLSPGSLTQALGDMAIKPTQNGAADNSVTLDGTSTVNSIANITQTTNDNGQRTTLTKNGAGTWTVGNLNGAYNARLIVKPSAGRLIVTGDIKGVDLQMASAATLELQKSGNLFTTPSPAPGASRAPNVITGGLRGTIDNTSGGLITFQSNPSITFTGDFTLAGGSVNMGTGATGLGATRQVTVSNAASTLTLGGIISGSTFGLTKAGAGTLELKGVNTYNGATAVNEGTLALTGGSQKSAITVASGAKLGLSPNTVTPATAKTTSTAALTLDPGHGIKIIGTVDNASDYLLMTASLITVTGTPVLDPVVPNYTLQVQNSGTELWLVYSSGATYTVTYDGNGSTGGTVPEDGSSPYATGATVTVPTNSGSLVKTGFVFTGWNTQADGLGTHYAATGSATFTMGAANTTLYAEWKTPYDNWAAGFTPNPGGVGANPDTDSFTNLQEFAFAFNPNVSDGSGPLTISGGAITQNGPPQIYEDPVTHQYFLRYTRRADYTTAGLTYTAQFAADSLGAGSFENVTGGDVVATGTGIGGVAIQAVAIEFPDALPVSGKKARFGRIEVTQTP